MTQVLHLTIALLPTKQRLLQRLPHTQRTASSTSETSFPTTGRTRAKLDVCRCTSQSQRPQLGFHLHQGQHAHVRQEGPDISRLDPVLQQQWDHVANAHLGNMTIKPHSHREVWWTCDQCPDAHLHSWSAVVYSRTNGNGCPQCSGRQVCKHNSLATKAPLVAAQWDYEANDGTPDNVVAQSNHLAHWHCKVCGCKWEATPNARVSKRKTGCPQCCDHAKTKKRTRHPTFAECNHLLLGEWDHKRNAAQGHYPDKITLKSNKQIFWLCAKCPAGQEHGWSAQPFNRTGRVKAGCPFCAGWSACRCNSLQALYPETATEWDYSENQGQPSHHPASSHHLAWWFSPQRGSWQQTINSRTSVVQQKRARLKRVQERHFSTGLKPGLTEV
ncbi:hypothetical protein ABBQ38_012260 [Trebouxia sp. C0009 RCD-2024]